MVELIHLSPQSAFHYLEQHAENSLLIDIRSSMEFLFVGHPVGAVHIPWVDEPDWEVNPDFIPTLERSFVKRCQLDKDAVRQQAHVVLCCRSGKRTLDAGQLLLTAGFQQVLHIDEGFEGELDENNQRGKRGGWRFHGFPWEQC